MTAHSNANTSGLDYFGYRVFNAGVGACWLVANPGPNDTNPEPLVTAASAQARIAAAEARADRLAKGMPDLSSVIGWLASGCDPTHAVDELRIYQARIDAALQQETQP